MPTPIGHDCKVVIASALLVLITELEEHAPQEITDKAKDLSDMVKEAFYKEDFEAIDKMFKSGLN